MRAPVLVVLMTTSAAADPDPVPPFVPERLALRGALEAGDTTSSLALDGWYDVNDRFRFGITTSHDARRQLGAGRGLCIAGCATRFSGLAAEAQVRLGPSLVGYAALDTVRFAPTEVALELGADLHWAQGRWSAVVSPSVRLGVARRDLDDNRDTGAVFGQLGPQLWSTGGVLALARLAGSLDHIATTPTIGAGGGAWLQLGPFTVSARAGSAHLVHRDSLFAEIAIGWSS